MDAAEVDVQVLSVCPQTFLYDRDPALTAALSAIQNEEIAKVVSQHPDRFLGIATLPMQDPERAVAELRRSMTDLGLRGAQIGSHVEGRNLDDPSLEPLWAAAAELGAFILIHPQKTAATDRLKSYYLKNLIGNPLDTTIAAASLVFGGVLERYPDLKFCFAHGGGFMPYQTGRMNHGYDVRPEGKVNLKEAPEASIRRLYFDCILHFEPALRYLVETFGADHVLLGSDYPFDMGLLDCVKQVRALKASIEDRNLILGTAAAGLLGDVQSPAKRAAQAG
jgi:aminocarboxymuconate-semialdehyde decarboxylase